VSQWSPQHWRGLYSSTNYTENNDGLLEYSMQLNATLIMQTGSEPVAWPCEDLGRKPAGHDT